jgi:NitT/TauT family transport system substrate-binding protein
VERPESLRRRDVEMPGRSDSGGSRIRAFILLAAFVLAAFVATGCGDDDDSGSDDSSSAESAAIPAEPESGTLVMGTQPWIGYGPLADIAPAEGIFEEEGLTDVEIQNFKSDKDISAAFASGRLDAMNAGLTQALTLTSVGVPVKIVLLEDVSTDADAVLGRGVDSVADLAGKDVAVEEGAVGDLMLRYALQQNDMTLDDINVVPTPASEAGTALIAGQIDAAVTYEPYVTQAQAEDSEITPVYTAGEKEGLVSDVLVVSEDMINERPGQVAALLRSYQSALDFYNDDPAEGQRIIGEALGADPSELKTAFEGIEFFDLQGNQEQFSGPYPETVAEVEDLMVDAGLLEQEVDTADLIDPQFVDETAN